MGDYSYMTNAHPTYIDHLYKTYKENPDSVEESWKRFFEGFEYQDGKTVSASGESLMEEFAVMGIIHGFRARGHLLATTNPIRPRVDRKPHLDLADYGLTKEALDKSYQAGVEVGQAGEPLKDIIKHLTKIYSANIGFEYVHVEDREKRTWLRNQIEQRSLADDYGLSIGEKKNILEKLNGAVVFEKFLHTKYVGQKRFSLEGGETTIAALDSIISNGSAAGIQEFVIGMAHRGRLNVLANIMGKTYEDIFSEFEGTAVPDLSFGDGDVKYHLGFSSQRKEGDKLLNIKLAPNPSHLESVGPVVEGYSRARADILYNSVYDRVLPILIHGDAAVAGQGVVYETAQMSNLAGYSTGGTIHFVINNQIGFTTDFVDARSSTYCTAAASMIQAPILHVNGDDPEAVVWATKLAIAYRQKFNSDVFIDMVCYRRHGHNEGDDPKFTQPEMYDIIKTHLNPRELYSKVLSERGDVQEELAKKLETEFWGDLQARLDAVKQHKLPYEYQQPEEAWRKLKKKTTAKDYEVSPITGISKKNLDEIIEKVLTIPDHFNPLGKVSRVLKGKHALLSRKKADWAMAEWMAYASLLREKRDVRITGQDVKRGTFSHRHAIFYDKDTFEAFDRLNNVAEEQGTFHIYNSLLSEFAVLGFEFGYSMATPDALVIWEAQFGDFYNGAQVMVDQFIMAAESKWQRMSGLVMLLPHGYEGQGPEHSSARLERFLQSCAEYNVTVANLTSPSNYFHLLRRQLYRPFRKPLIVMSPKSLLRHPECVSDLTEFTSKNKFQEVLDDESISKTGISKVKRLLLCSGKVFFDLKAYQKENKVKNIAVVALEQLYPFPESQIQSIVAKYKNAEVIWVQEEPANMGAWTFVAMELGLNKNQVVSRKQSASPATGFKEVHVRELKEFVDKAFSL